MLAARCGSELGAGDVLVATEKQDCRDAPVGARALTAAEGCSLTPHGIRVAWWPLRFKLASGAPTPRRRSAACSPRASRLAPRASGWLDSTVHSAPRAKHRGAH